MAPTIEERFRSNSGDNTSATVGYLITNATSYADAFDELQGASSLATFNGLPRQQVRVDEVNGNRGIYYGEIQYTFDPGRKKPKPTRTKPDNQNYRDVFQFTAGLRNQNFKWLSQLPYNDAFPDWPSAYQNMIQFQTTAIDPDSGQPFPLVEFDGLGWQGTERGFEGLEFPVPTGNFSLNYYPSNLNVSQAYLKRITDNMGTVNSKKFHGHDPGEVMLIGANGASRTDESWAITFDFETRPKRTDVRASSTVVIPELNGFDTVEAVMQKKKVTIPPDNIANPPRPGGEKTTEVLRQVRVIRSQKWVDFEALLDPEENFP